MEVKIAVIGQSESGKSSFINNLLGENVAVHDDSDALTVKQYAAPKNEAVKVFEIPAIDGDDILKDSYFGETIIDANNFDLVLFVTKDKLGRDDCWVIKRFQEMEVSVTILRSYMDVTLKNAKRKSAGVEIDVETVSSKICTALREKLKQNGVLHDQISIHSIANHDLYELDLCESVRSMVEMIANEKRDFLRSALNDDLNIQFEIPQLLRWQDVKVNIGLVGQPGCGKSTFIKSFMGDTFPTDCENVESGKQIFRCQKNPNIEFHEFSTARIIELTGTNQELLGLDYVFFLTEKSATGFLNAYRFLLRRVSCSQIPGLLLRTHADLLVKNDHMTEKQKELTINHEREAIRKLLKQRNLELPVKLVDAKSVVEFEYLEALEDLLTRVDERRRVSLVNSLEAFEQCYSWYPTRVDIAVVGSSRNGKSSFINALVGSEVAAISHIGNCTTETTEYSVPNYPNIRLYDIPGISATQCTREQFAEKAKLDKNNYDTFFIVIKDVFNDDAKFIMEQVKTKGRSYSIVRTHADDTAAKFADEKAPKQVIDQNTTNEIKIYLMKQFQELGVLDANKIQMYVISNNHINRFDFPQLLEDLSRTLPKVKAQQFLLGVTSFDPKIIEAKMKELHGTKRRCALASGTCGLIPIPGINVAADIGIFISTTVTFISALGLSKDRISNQEKLQRLSKGRLETNLVDYMEKQKFDVLLALRNSKYFKEGLKASSAGTIKLIAVVGPLIARGAALMSADEVMKAIPPLMFLGMVVGCLTSFGMTWYLLDKELKNAESCALFVSQLIRSTKK